MLELLTIPLLALHLLAMNVASVGPIVAAWLYWRGDDYSMTLGRDLTRASIHAFVAGMLTGGLLILVIPGTSLWAALERFPANAYWFAGGELLFSLACMAILTWGWPRFNIWGILALALISATNLLYHFPPLMAVIGKLAANPSFTVVEIIDRPALRELMSRAEVAALSFHFGCSAIAVSAITLIYLIFREDAEQIAERAAVTRGAAAVAFVATLCQVPVGVWLLISLPGASRMSLMGKSLGGSLAFIAAMVLSLILLQRLFTTALGDVDRKNLRTVVMLTCIVVVLMTASLRLSRFIVPQAGVAAKTSSYDDARDCCGKRV